MWFLKVASIVAVVEKMGIRVEWIGRVSGEISARNLELLREAWLLWIQFEELQEEMEGVEQRLTELDMKMSHMNFSYDSIENHEIQVEKEKSEIVMLYILFEWMINFRLIIQFLFCTLSIFEYLVEWNELTQ